jgi:hypothetical protein
MRLEDLRGPHVGDSAMVLQSAGQPLAAAFHHHAEQAQWHTLNCLVRLSGSRVDGVANERIAVVEWWRTIESLIALVFQVAILESDLNIRKHRPRLNTTKRAGVLDRWSAIANWFTEATASAPGDVTQRVVELRNFRNSFEHATREAAIDVHASRLGTLPAHANLSDAMEAMAICVEASSVIRGIIKGADLMPQCVVPSKRHVFYVGLDIMAEHLVMPQYRRLVRALGLTSDVDLYPAPPPLPGASILRPAFVVKAEPGPEDVELTAPIDLWSAFEAFAEAQPGRPGPGRFGLPRYQQP